MSASAATPKLAAAPASPLTARIAAEFAASANASGGPRRQHALAALVASGLPTSRDENWKYVNLRPLEKVRFVPPSAEARPAITQADLPTAVGKSRYVFVDGVFDASLSSPSAEAGVTVTTVAAGAAPKAGSTGSANGGALAVDGAGSPNGGSRSGGGAGAPTHGALVAGGASAANDGALPGDLRFALLNEAFATDGAQIHVARGTDCEICVELVFVATAEAKAGASYPRVSFKVDANARVGLIERHVSIGSDANFINCSVDVEVGRDASVQHYRVQQTGARAIWFDTLTAKLAENAKYQVYMVSLGALSARSTVNVQLLGERSEVGVFGASVGGKNQVHDTFALVDHVAPNARTEQSFRGIAGGRARVAFNGKVVVRKGAHGTDSSQSLRGLLAGTDAEIDVRPQLEIYTDDVRCNHGATAGKLDDNMLFYLLSRGLDRDTALRLLKWAFLEDVVSKIQVPQLRQQIEENLAGRLEAPVPMGAPHAAHGQAGDGLPWIDGERAAPAQTENL
ncbi:MAG TPA: Fe-S cluster assembly protein SufD [Steroidobacteraceae bacterium]|jgi:Fe-S cluster assembly protein SufD